MNFSVRLSRTEDQEHIQHVRRLAWIKAYQGLLPEEVIEQATGKAGPRTSQRVFAAVSDEVIKSRISLVAECPKNGILGFVAGGLQRQNIPNIDCELWAIYVHPEFQGHGLGKSLHQQFQQAMRERGHKTMVLWTLKENKSSRAFYEKIGGTLHTTTKPFEWDGKVVAEEVAYVWELSD
jgi:ribosomal protein S18 acetylase RimI-like enzyme